MNYRKIEEPSGPPVVLVIGKRTQTAHVPEDFGQPGMHPRTEIHIHVFHYRGPSFHVLSGLANNEHRFHRKRECTPPLAPNVHVALAAGTLVCNTRVCYF